MIASAAPTVREERRARPPVRRRRRHVRRLASNAAPHALLLLFSIATLAPFVWTLGRSVTSPSGTGWALDNYAATLRDYTFTAPLMNSLLVAGSVTVAALLTSTLAGFVFAKYHFRGREPLFTTLIACMMIPSTVIALPLFVNLTQLGLGQSLGALIVVGLWSPFGIFTLRQFMEGIPSELLDAARIDGASEWRILGRVLAPMCTSALAVLAVYAFMQSWDNFLLPTILFQWTLQPQNWTLPLQTAGDAALPATPDLAAVVMLMTLPPLLVFLAAAAFFIRDVTLTGAQG